MITCHGSFQILLLYDIADQIDLRKVRQLLRAGSPERRPEFKLATPEYVRFENPPVVQAGETIRLPTRQPLEATLKYFDYGVVSLTLECGFQTSWDELIALSSRWIESPDVEEHARQVVQAQGARIGPALEKPYSQWLEEVYYIVELHEVHAANGNVFEGSDLVEHLGPGMAQIIRGEMNPLSEAEQKEVLASNMSFYPSDLLVVGWMAALIYDTPEGAAPIVQLLEYANAQLLEYRRYDETLTKVLQQAYDGLERKNRLLARWRLANEAHRLNALRLDITALAERTENAIKFLSDMFYARVYQLVAAKVGVRDYRNLVEAKLRTAGDLYEFMVNEFREARSFLLESMVVAILIIDLILLIGGRK